MRRIRGVAAIGLLLAAMTAGTATPTYAHPAKPDFATQAHDVGLTGAQAASLQERVNTYLARTGGTQTAINKIDLDGKAELVLTLPGENRTREIGASGLIGVQAICDQGNFCAFRQQNYNGDVLRYYYCADKLSMPWAGYGSYLNNQTGGVSAHFYDSTAAYMYDSLAAVYGSPTFNWTPVYWIKPCGGI
jgi:hypothetical protein